MASVSPKADESSSTLCWLLLQHAKIHAVGMQHQNPMHSLLWTHVLVKTLQQCCTNMYMGLTNAASRASTCASGSTEPVLLVLGPSCCCCSACNTGTAHGTVQTDAGQMRGIDRSNRDPWSLNGPFASAQTLQSRGHCGLSEMSAPLLAARRDVAGYYC